MKRIKLFEITYVLNSFLYLTSIARAIYNELLFLTVWLFIIFILIITPFNWACYTLNKSYRKNLQVSNRTDTAMIITGIFFNIFTVFMIIDMILLVYEYFIYGYSNSTRTWVYYCLFFCFVVTCIYLAINYWIVRKQIKLKLITAVSSLGEKDKS
jgi:hypothetical protein